LQIADHGAVIRAELAAKGVGIGFEREKISPRADNLVFVNGAFADFRKEKFPDAGRAARTHGMDASVPVIHVADDADAFGGRRPDGEVSTGDSRDGVKVRAKFFVGVKVTAFVHQVKVEVGEEKRESVRVKKFKRFAEMGAALDFVAARFGRSRLIGGPHGFEESLGTKFAGVGNFCRRDGRNLESDAGFGGPGNEKADGPAGENGMRAENAEGISILSGQEGIGAGIEFRALFTVHRRGRRSGCFDVFGRQGWILRQRTWERKHAG